MSLRVTFKSLEVLLDGGWGKRLPDADLRVLREFINWMDDTPAATRALGRLGVTWELPSERQERRLEAKATLARGARNS